MTVFQLIHADYSVLMWAASAQTEGCSAQHLTDTQQLSTLRIHLDVKQQHLPFSPVSSMDSEKSK